MTPKMHDDEVGVDTALVRRLLAEQFPRWADLVLERVSSTGTDNAIFRLGSEIGIRVPRIHWAVQQIDKEYQWLNRLAAHLPVPVAEPLAKGEPGQGYPYPWLIFRWLEGRDLLASPVEDVSQLAREVADFVLALEEVDLSDAPPALSCGGPLAPADEATRRAIRGLDPETFVRAMKVWDAALEADSWTGPPVWVHGDLFPGNILVRGGRLAGIVDWSAAGSGDPVCEVMLAWSLPPAARAIYREELAVDEATWARAMGWSVYKAAQFIPYYAETIPDGVAAAKRRLDAILDECDP
jgi:aminoglycoside phosphotransferase (APT) family kinase protein